MIAITNIDQLSAGDWYWSIKYDGVRARWDGHALWTRSNRRINAPDWFTAGWPRHQLDGELWMGLDTFDTMQGIANSKTPDDAAWHKVTYRVFDVPYEHESWKASQKRIAKLRCDHIIPVEQFRLNDLFQADYGFVIALGHEGVVLRDAAVRWQSDDDSGHVYKIKPRYDAEAVVVAHLGTSMEVEYNGVRFRIAWRYMIPQPKVGETVTFTYRNITPRGVPREAAYKRVRTI